MIQRVNKFGIKWIWNTRCSTIITCVKLLKQYIYISLKPNDHLYHLQRTKLKEWHGTGAGVKSNLKSIAVSLLTIWSFYIKVYWWAIVILYQKDKYGRKHRRKFFSFLCLNSITHASPICKHNSLLSMLHLFFLTCYRHLLLKCGLQYQRPIIGMH